MEKDLGECAILEEFLRRRPPCHQTCTRKKFPSYYKAGIGKGCWVAHTALCMLEATMIKDDILPILERKAVKWRTLFLTLLLHDSGKLSKEYVLSKTPKIPHNEISAQIAHDALKKLQGKNYLDDNEVKVISRVCFLHMEYYEWKNLLKGGYATISQTTTPGATIELSDDVKIPLENLKLVLEEAGLLNEVIHAIIFEIPSLKKLKLMPSNYTIDKYTSKEICLKAMTLQWFVLLLDNRASSARTGIDAYWAKSFKKVRGSIVKPYSNPETIIEFSDNLLKMLRGRLTPLPKTY
ncbi:MAG: hypothetical protein NDF52_09305 [archaeon YNP-WB-062]|nr:hypothetical protein [Candidatus Culexarchaeum yellowstonense]